MMIGCRFRLEPPYALRPFEGTITHFFGYGSLGTWAMFDSVDGPGIIAPLHLTHLKHLSGCAVEHRTGEQADHIIIDDPLDPARAEHRREPRS